MHSCTDTHTQDIHTPKTYSQLRLIRAAPGQGLGVGHVYLFYKYRIGSVVATRPRS